jgi:hypothetical protein
MAGFQVSTNGRFWVSTEGLVGNYRSDAEYLPLRFIVSVAYTES